VNRSKQTIRRIIYLAAALVAASLALFFALRESPVKVETARVARGRLQVTIDAEGRTRVHDRYVVSAPVAGLLRRIEHHRGDRVIEGGAVAIIEPAPWAATPSTDRGQAEGAAPSAVVRSPMNGSVLRVIEENERVVAAGTPLLELSNTPQLEIVVDVLSTDAVRISAGAPVLIEEWGGSEAMPARVRLVEPSAFTKISALGIEEQRVNVIAHFVGAHGALGDGYRIEARIVVWEGDNVLKVPSSALFRRGQGWSAFTFANGRARRREVEVGHRAALEVEIVRGLEEGDEIILHPTNLIDDGARVEPL
jgi:HlyD family secretion protein